MEPQQRAEKFLEASDERKLAFAQELDRERFNGWLMIHLLLEFTPNFLLLDEIWVDKLLKAE